ncbi:hypothetical protein AWZ03_010013 [Drosophila navojoa]|uniref:Uncharacterized protein n=1 Tax=Drosophila navojoa TaxID=7232 RepID=A0A484B6X0_DRONA|nr:hypothetical protein AWZ03_010013 [Drosophila navojoa]
MKKLTLAYMLIRLGVYITVSRHMASAAMGWYIMHYRRELCRLLNQFLRLAKMHREIFRRDVHVPWLWLLIHFMRELYLAFYFTPFSVGFGGSLNFVTARLPFLFVLLDVGLMIHHNMIRSLAEHYDELSHSRDLKRACLEYFEQLVQLKPKLQQFCWISTLARLSIEMMLTMMLCLIEFWMHYMPGNKIYLISIIIECALMSNMLSNIRVARSIELMESKILHHLYQDEILFSLKHLKATRNWRMEKVIAD